MNSIPCTTTSSWVNFTSWLKQLRSFAICRNSRLTSRTKSNTAAASCVIGCVLVVMAASVCRGQAIVPLEWDASISTNVTGYKLYASTNVLTATNLSSALVKLNTGTNRSVQVLITNVANWRFVATAYTAQGIESGPSNELIVGVPAPPPNMRTLVVQASGTLVGTNWLDVGYFRLRIEP